MKNGSMPNKRLRMLYNYRGPIEDLTVTDDERYILTQMKFHDMRKLKIDEALYSTLSSKKKRNFERAYKWYNKIEYKNPNNTTIERDK